MSLFSKLKDYNKQLEEVLDDKYFSSNIKNLLFNMIYKIEIFYPDFYQVKRCVRNKEDLLNELVETIRLYCDNIKSVEPDSDQAKMLIRHKLQALTNEKERSILTYPTEIALLYAISDISPKYFYINQENTLKKLIQNTLVNGYNMNNVEILKDFNGWSWDKSDIENENYIDNLIYQNLLVMLGEKFLYEWRIYGSTRRDFLLEAKKYIKLFTGNENYISYFYKLLYLNSNAKDRLIINEELKVKKQKLRKMLDRENFLQECKSKKEKLTQKLEKIENALENEERLEKDFIKANLKLSQDKQIKSFKKYKNLVIKEKEKYIEEIYNLEYILQPSNYTFIKNLLQEVLQVYNCKETEEEVLINLQKEFLIFIEKKLSKIKTRDEIIDVICELRYYSKLKISKNKTTLDISEINEVFDRVLKKAITILCKIGAMKIISMDINLNFEIIKYALDTKIINLEEIKIALVTDDQGLIIKVFDKDIFEKQGRKKIEISKNILEVKTNRKIKIFN